MARFTDYVAEPPRVQGVSLGHLPPSDACAHLSARMAEPLRHPGRPGWWVGYTFCRECGLCRTDVWQDEVFVAESN